MEMDKLKVGLFSENLDESCFILHSIQGLSGNIGAIGVYKQSKDLSSFIKEHGCNSGIDKFEDLYSTVHEYNEHIKNQLSSLTEK